MPGVNGVELMLGEDDTRELARCFEIELLHVPADNDHAGMDEISLAVRARINALVAQHRQVALLGPSVFGSLVALASALDHHADKIAFVVLVNCGTAFSMLRSPLARAVSVLPPEALQFGLDSALAFSLMGNAYRLIQRARSIVGDDSSLSATHAYSRWCLVRENATRLRTRMLRENELSVNTVLVSGTADALLPSELEAAELQFSLRRLNAFQKCVEHISVINGSHALAEDGSASLHSVLLQESDVINAFLHHDSGADTHCDEHSSSAVPEGTTRQGSDTTMVTNDSSYAMPGARTTTDAKIAADRLGSILGFQTFSTLSSGTVVRGLEGVSNSARPRVLVGNHQTYAVDLVLIVHELLRQRNVLARGVAHPVLFDMQRVALPSRLGVTLHSLMPGADGDASCIGTEGKIDAEEGARPLQALLQALGGEPDDFRELIEEFGAVKASGRNLFRLLEKQETVLLYPGGVTEACSDTRWDGNRYKLQWPSDPSLISLCCMKGAEIVPFGAVGVEDNLTTIVSREEQLKSPIGGALKWLLKDAPRVQQGEELWPPLALPNPLAQLDRAYIKFGKPIDTAGVSHKDKDEVQLLYSRVQASVEEQLAYLLAKREEDPFRRGSTRIPYELLNGFKSAPTFEP